MWVKRHPFAIVTSRAHTFPEPNASMSSVVATATKTDVVGFSPHVVIGVSPCVMTTPRWGRVHACKGGFVSVDAAGAASTGAAPLWTVAPAAAVSSSYPASNLISCGIRPKRI